MRVDETKPTPPPDKNVEEKPLEDDLKSRVMAIVRRAIQSERQQNKK